MSEIEIIFLNQNLINPLTPLWLLPIIYIALVHIFARREKVMPYIKAHFPTRVADWLFVPFNLGLVFFAYFVLEQVILLTTVSLAAMLWMNIVWKNNANGGTSISHKKGKMYSVGIIHTIYGVIQLVLVGVYFFSPGAQTIWFYLSSISLILFFALCMRNQLTQKILKGHYKPELFFHALGIALVLLKIVAVIW